MFFGAIEEATIEIKQGDIIMHTENVFGPAILLQQQFIKMMEDIAQVDVPFRVRMYKEVFIESTGKVQINEISFGNNAYVSAFPDEYRS